MSSSTHVTDEAVRCPASFRTSEYLYIYGGDEWPSELYDLKSDPAESLDVFGSRVDVARDLHEQYIGFLAQIGCPAQSLDARRQFNPTPRPNLPYRRVI